jgi:hypothetical protein
VAAHTQDVNEETFPKYNALAVTGRDVVIPAKNILPIRRMYNRIP